MIRWILTYILLCFAVNIFAAIAFVLMIPCFPAWVMVHACEWLSRKRIAFKIKIIEQDVKKMLDESGLKYSDMKIEWFEDDGSEPTIKVEEIKNG